MPNSIAFSLLACALTLVHVLIVIWSPSRSKQGIADPDLGVLITRSCFLCVLAMIPGVNFVVIALMALTIPMKLYRCWTSTHQWSDFLHQVQIESQEAADRQVESGCC
jgi:hypothetical protein